MKSFDEFAETLEGLRLGDIREATGREGEPFATAFSGRVRSARGEPPSVAVYDPHIEQTANLLDLSLVTGVDGGADAVNGGVDLLYC